MVTLKATWLDMFSRTHHLNLNEDRPKLCGTYCKIHIFANFASGINIIIKYPQEFSVPTICLVNSSKMLAKCQIKM